MDLKVDHPEPCLARVAFTVPSAEYEQEFQKALREVGARAHMKGFRPGHVPPQVIERLQGREIRQELRQHFVQQAYERAVKEHELRVLAHPRVDLGEKEVLAGADFTFEFDVQLRPKFELQTYTGLEIESRLAPILDAEVEAAIEQARRQQTRPEAAGEAGLPEDGMALARVVLEFEGETVFERDGLRLTPKSPLPGLDTKAFEQALIGALDGAAVELPIVFPADFEKEAARGREGRCRIEVAQAYKLVVPTREELAKTLGVEDEAALKALARRKLEEASREQENARVETALLDRLIDAHAIELPETLVEQQTQARLEQSRAALAEQGMTEALIEEELSKQRAAAREGAARAAKAFFLVERIAESEQLKVTDSDLAQELRAIARRNRASYEEVRDYYREQGLVPQLANEILERKVRRRLRETAVVREPAA